jgi:hypothetical protein
MNALIATVLALGQTAPDATEAARAMERAVRFFRTSVASNGGYLWRYSSDLAKREGEGKADPDCVWVQPPGTPAVGAAYLAAYERTGERYLLDAAREVGDCLVRGQLGSGGWAAEIRFDPGARARWAYIADGPRSGARNVSSLDDDMTQSAIRFLVKLDRALGGRDRRIREAADIATGALLGAQYPIGAWPQGFSGPNRGSTRPIRPASLPAVWPRLYTGQPYSEHYTLNDNVMLTVVETLLEVYDIRHDRRCRQAAIRGGEFLLRAQLPDPQPGWAQQYNAEMEPAWARKFEPPAITGGESQNVMSTLIRLAERTGEARFLAPVPKAIAYYRRLTLPDGRLARFYEIGTDRPLYFTRRYELTYDDTDLPTHYAFKVTSHLDAIAREHARVVEALRTGKRTARAAISAHAAPSVAEVRRLVESLDDRGAWVEDGRLRYHGDGDDTRRIIDCATFIRNLDALSRHVAAERAARPVKRERRRHEDAAVRSQGSQRGVTE